MVPYIITEVKQPWRRCHNSDYMHSVIFLSIVGDGIQMKLSFLVNNLLLTCGWTYFGMVIEVNLKF